MNEIKSWEENLFDKYSKFKTTDKLKTDHSLLEEEQTRLVESALNQVFINPRFKMKHFVPSGQLTPYSTVRQWLLELKTTEEAIETFELRLKRFDLEKEILELKIDREADLLVRKQLQLELLKTTQDLGSSKRRVMSHYMERENYLSIINEYLEGPNGKTPDGKSWMDVFNTPEEDKYESEYWTVRLAKQAAMDIVGYGRISAGNIDAITQLERAQQETTLALAHEVSLRVESTSNHIRNTVHMQLLKNDPGYALSMNNKTPDDFNKIEFNVNDMVPESEVHYPNNKNNQDDLLNVYNP
jgi:hypothetical protein